MVTYENAQPVDIPAIAELYQQAFPEALEAVFGKARLPARAVEDVFSSLYHIEPGGFLVARETERAVGCEVVVRSLKSLERQLWRGEIWRWAGHWLGGRYSGLGLGFIPRLIKAAWDYRGASLSDGDMAQVLTVIVDPHDQGRGIASRLTELSLAYLKTTSASHVRLEVDAAKPGPIHLYQKFGFREIARIPSPRGPALVMTLSLN